jgi:DNA-binding IclR family transcriptional regulator
MWLWNRKYWPAPESKAEKILVYMALRPQAKYTSIELADAADAAPKNVHTLLGPCMKHGLVTQERQGRNIFLRLSQHAAAQVATQAPERPADPVRRRSRRRVWHVAHQDTPRSDVLTLPVSTRSGATWTVPMAPRSVFYFGALQHVSTF